MNDLKRMAITRTKTGAWAWVCLRCGADEIVRGDTNWAKREAHARAEDHKCGREPRRLHSA